MGKRVGGKDRGPPVMAQRPIFVKVWSPGLGLIYGGEGSDQWHVGHCGVVAGESRLIFYSVRAIVAGCGHGKVLQRQV